MLADRNFELLLSLLSFLGTTETIRVRILLSFIFKTQKDSADNQREPEIQLIYNRYLPFILFLVIVRYNLEMSFSAQINPVTASSSQQITNVTMRMNVVCVALPLCHLLLQSEVLRGWQSEVLHSSLKR